METKQPATTYLDKEMALIEAIQNDNGKIFASKEEGLDAVSACLSNISDYVNKLTNYAAQLTTLREQYEGGDLRDRVINLDMSCKHAHDCAVDSITILNRISASFGLEPFAEVDTTNRSAVRDFCGKFVIETYNNAIGGTHG